MENPRTIWAIRGHILRLLREADGYLADWYLIQLVKECGDYNGVWIRKTLLSLVEEGRVVSRRGPHGHFSYRYAGKQKKLDSYFA